MKYCSNCGTQMEADIKFCAQCGTKTETEAQPAPVAQPPVMAAVPSAAAKKPSKNAIIGIVILAAIIGIAAFFFLRDTTGLVGTWEISDVWWGEVETVAIEFRRNGSGSIRHYWNGVLENHEGFNWRVISAGLVEMTSQWGDRELVRFNRSGRVLWLDEEPWNRR